MTMIRVFGLSRSSFAGASGASGAICRIWPRMRLSRSSPAAAMSSSACCWVRSPAATCSSASACAAAFRSLLSRARSFRVLRLRPTGCSSGSEAATRSAPSTVLAVATARSGPTRRAKVVSSWATSIRSVRSLAAMSPPERLTRQPVLASTTSSDSPVSRRCAIRRSCSAPTDSQSEAITWSVISSSPSSSSVRPGTCSYTSIAASGPSSEVATSCGARAPEAAAA